VNVHFNAYFYGEMMFISVNGEVSKQQGKQLFTGWGPVSVTFGILNKKCSNFTKFLV